MAPFSLCEPGTGAREGVAIRPNLTTLRMFLSAYMLGNLSKAAARENIAPSAISKRLQDLENEVGAPLFYRHARGVTPTPAGEVLAEHVRRIFDDVNRMSADLSEFTSGVRGQVRIHAHSSAVVQYLPSQIAGFVHSYPGVRVVLREETSPNVLQSTIDGVADIGIFASNLPAPPGLQVLSYKRDQLVALFSNADPLSRRASITLPDLRECDHIVLETGSSLQILLTQMAASLGFELNTRIEVKTFEAAMRMVEAGLGVAIMPGGVVSACGGNLDMRAVPLSHDWARRSLVICIRDEEKLTASARLMLHHLRAEAGTDSYRKTNSPVPNQ
jgi:DNA-binding transcriptional LysR family regulator